MTAAARHAGDWTADIVERVRGAALRCHWYRLPCQHGLMMTLKMLGRVTGSISAAMGAFQFLGGVRGEPGMSGNTTTDSHVRFMGPIFIGYSLGWFDAASSEPDLARMRRLAGLMALGGVGRLVARRSGGRPHRLHDVLLAIELGVPVAVEVAARNPAGQSRG